MSLIRTKTQKSVGVAAKKSSNFIFRPLLRRATGGLHYQRRAQRIIHLYRRIGARIHISRQLFTPWEPEREREREFSIIMRVQLAPLWFFKRTGRQQHQQRLHTTTRTEYNAERASGALPLSHLRRGAITTSSQPPPLTLGFARIFLIKNAAALRKFINLSDDGGGARRQRPAPLTANFHFGDFPAIPKKLSRAHSPVHTRLRANGVSAMRHDTNLDERERKNWKRGRNEISRLILRTSLALQLSLYWLPRRKTNDLQSQELPAQTFCSSHNRHKS